MTIQTLFAGLLMLSGHALAAHGLAASDNYEAVGTLAARALAVTVLQGKAEAILQSTPFIF